MLSYGKRYFCYFGVDIGYLGCPWGTLMWWAGALEEAVYTTASVTWNWTGAEIQKPLSKYREKKWVTYGHTDGRT